MKAFPVKLTRKNDNKDIFPKNISILYNSLLLNFDIHSLNFNNSLMGPWAYFAQGPWDHLEDGGMNQMTPPDIGFEIGALTTWGPARYLTVTEPPPPPHTHTLLNLCKSCVEECVSWENETSIKMHVLVLANRVRDRRAGLTSTILPAFDNNNRCSWNMVCSVLHFILYIVMWF